MKTQSDRIRAALDAGRYLTQLDMFKLCGTLKGGNRCNELAAKGYPLAKMWVTRNGKRVMSYWKRSKRK
jgi:hypothetical protein